MWGLGGLTFGLTMRYLGLSLGMAVALGYCAAFGTLVPPVFHGEFASRVLGTGSGRVILLGVAVCLAGIGFAGWAGISKERETTAEERRATIEEFDFGRGILVATFSGVMSACFAYALDAATPMAAASLARGTPPIWTGLPKLIVVLLGGFTTNLLWCAYLNFRNHTAGQYFSARRVADAVERVPLAANYFWSGLAGITWYLQFFFYTMGESQMGRYGFSSWTLHMASIIIFSSLWGIGFKEWKGAGARAGWLLTTALFLLVASTVIVGYGNYQGLAHAGR